MDVMLDLETMSTDPNAAIVAIGAVKVDLANLTLGDTFYRTVDLASAVKAGGVMDPGTIMWWMQQSQDAREALWKQPITITEALVDFQSWLADPDVSVWGNGAAFDNVILGNAYKRLGQVTPWPYWNDRCYRTMKALHPDIKYARTGTHHNALSDAITQAKHLVKIFASMRRAEFAA